MKLYFAADHAGFALKQALIEFARAEGHEVEDCGAFDHDPDDDYPPYVGAAARALARDVAAGVESRAVVVGASGQGEAMAANRFKGVRCALYYGPAGRVQTDASGKELDLLASTREHNDANALALAARFVYESEAKEALKRWLSIPFSREERHVRRIAGIDQLG